VHRWRLVFLVLLPLAAAGCVLPPAVTVVSLAADGVSYLATGKTVTDHGLSAATARDCALLRPVLERRPVCGAYDSRGKDVPVVAGGGSVPHPGGAATGSGPTGDRYVSLGSFGDAASATAAAARYASYKPAVVTVAAPGRLYRRLVVGPLKADEATALEARLAADSRTARR